MVYKFFPNLKNSEKGISLVELVVVIFIITLFSLIIISDFPKIQRQFALSRATYKLAQDLRKAQDLGLSGVTINDKNGVQIPVKGYGVYVNLSQSNAQYLVYADVGLNDPQKYSGDPVSLCADVNQASDGQLAADCVLEVINVKDENQSLSIENPIINTITGQYTSINFAPPSPIINIDNINTNNNPPDNSKVGIVLKNTDGSTRTVWINTSGLINIQ